MVSHCDTGATKLFRWLHKHTLLSKNFLLSAESDRKTFVVKRMSLRPWSWLVMRNNPGSSLTKTDTRASANVVDSETTPRPWKWQHLWSQVLCRFVASKCPSKYSLNYVLIKYKWVSYIICYLYHVSSSTVKVGYFNRWGLICFWNLKWPFIELEFLVLSCYLQIWGLLFRGSI